MTSEETALLAELRKAGSYTDLLAVVVEQAAKRLVAGLVAKGHREDELNHAALHEALHEAALLRWQGEAPHVYAGYLAEQVGVLSHAIAQTKAAA